jgi:hypothetical protein
VKFRGDLSALERDEAILVRQFLDVGELGD